MSVEEARKYRDLLESVLLEAQNYEEMFADIEGIPNIKKSAEIKNVINLSKMRLKKKDRIVWFLRLYRIALLEWFYFWAETNDDSSLDQVSALLKKYKSQIGSQDSVTGVLPGVLLLPNCPGPPALEQLEHFLSLPIPEIQNFKFAYQNYRDVITLFSQYEKKWQESVKDLIPFDPNDGTAIISFNDGFAWYNLNREYCNKEGKAMGHCGNAPSRKEGDRVLSLRKKVKVGNKIYVRPSLTFILHKDGYLGEMKGRANNKPEAKYHSYIVALLKSDIVKGIKGGGHAPERNFSLLDLDNDTIKHLLDEKSKLFTIGDLAELPNKGIPIDEKYQLAAVKLMPSAIKWINNPSEIVQFTAIQRDVGAIKYIENPSEAVQLAAVQQDANIAQFIKKPSKSVQSYIFKMYKPDNEKLFKYRLEQTKMFLNDEDILIYWFDKNLDVLDDLSNKGFFIDPEFKNKIRKISSKALKLAFPVFLKYAATHQFNGKDVAVVAKAAGKEHEWINILKKTVGVEIQKLKDSVRDINKITDPDEHDKRMNDYKEKLISLMKRIG